MKPLLRFSGSHRDVGRAHGEALREAVRESLDFRMTRCERATRGSMGRNDILDLARACLTHVGEYVPGQLEEVEGIAEAAGVSPEEVLIISGYTDFNDVVKRKGAGEACECTACWVSREASRDGSSFVAQTWDMFAEASEGAVWVHTAVEGEPEIFVLTYGGCVGMMGMNDRGVAVAANNLGPTDAVTGVPWTFICRAMLACENTESAADELERARLCSGHHFLIGDSSGTGISIETTGRRSVRIPIEESTYAHTNHYLDPGLKKVEKKRDPKGCSSERLARIDTILRDGRGGIDSIFIQNALRDHEGKPRSICSHDYELSNGTRIRSCGALVMDAVRREVAYITGNPCGGEFSIFSF